MSLKLCKDCTYFEPQGEDCNNSSSIKVYDLLYGNHEKISAKGMRGDDNRCGFMGNLFAEKMVMSKQPNFVEGGYIL